MHEFSDMDEVTRVLEAFGGA
ncbi:MAG: hypothetical protein WDO18_16860 [Acidobacteriota bacterium]